MQITIHTDAGYSITKKIGTYAFILLCDDFVIMRSGVFKKFPTHSSEAEAWCILNALTLAVKTAQRPVECIHIHTDSMVCINSFNSTLKYDFIENLKFGEIMRIELEKVIRKYQIKCPVKFIHVKGHTKNPTDGPGMANAWCDKEVNRAKNGKFKNVIAK